MKKLFFAVVCLLGLSSVSHACGYASQVIAVNPFVTTVAVAPVTQIVATTPVVAVTPVVVSPQVFVANQYFVPTTVVVSNFNHVHNFVGHGHVVGRRR